MENALLEKLSALEHEQWCAWTRYMLNNYSEENVTRWKRQMKIDYDNLPEDEKVSDRKWAKKVLEILEEDEKY